MIDIITKRNILIVLSVFLVLVVFTGCVSATGGENDTLTQNIDEIVDQSNNEILTVDLSSAGEDSGLKEHESQNNSLFLKSSDEQVLYSGRHVSGSTFQDIQTVIDEANDGDTIYLNGWYTVESGNELSVNKSLTIEGINNAILDGQSKSRIFTINSNGVTLKNITFINAHAERNFTDNSATENGGAVYFVDSGTVSNCNFTGNTATRHGGAVYFENSGNVTNCNFINNKATGTNSWGGAVYFENSGNVTNCNFTGNTATGGGGAINMGSGTVSNCNFIDNSAGFVGAVYIEDNGVVTGCNFVNNTATEYAGALAIASGVVTGCNFTNNKITGNDEGADAVFMASNGEITNSVFINNHNDNRFAICSQDSITADYNWWGHNATNYQDNPFNLGLINKDVVKNWYFLNMTANKGIATISLNNLYNNTTCTVSKDDDCKLPGQKFTLTATNASFSTKYVIVNGAANVNYEVNGIPAILTASIETVSITQEAQKSGDFELLQMLIDDASENSIINLERNYTYTIGIDAIKDGIVINKNLTINGNGFTIDAKGQSRIFNIAYNDVILNEITFKNGYHRNYGGAVYFSDNGTVSNCNFIGNTAKISGGAVNFKSGIVINCNFIGSTASDGGAVNFKSGIVSNCNFIGSTANSGGAVFIQTGNVINCNFIGNNASDMVGYGGAICIYNNGNVSYCNFTNNTAAKNGGAVYFRNTGTVEICKFDNNSALKGGAIFSNKALTVTADTCIFKTDSDTTYNTQNFSPILNVSNFTTDYGSDEKLTFDLRTNITRIPVTDGLISISVYFKDNNSWVGNYSCLSGEGWIVDLPVGSYYAIFDTEYVGFQPINRTITITSPGYYITVTSLTTNNKTVNITAKSNIPNDIVGDKLLFILPKGIEISAKYASNGIWWAAYTFDDYGSLSVNASCHAINDVTINNATITILKSIDSNSVDVEVVSNKGNVTVNVTVPEDFTGNVGVVIDDVSYPVSVVDGSGNVIIPLTVGDHTVRGVNLTNDPKYNDTFIPKNIGPVSVLPFDIKPGDINVDIIPTGDRGAVLNVTVPSDVNGNVNVVVDNISYPVVVVNGHGSIVISKMPSTNNVAVIIANDTKYGNVFNVVNLTVSSVFLDSNKDVKVFYLEPAVYSVHVVDNNGKPVVGALVKFTVNGKVFKATTNNLGVASVSPSLAPGKYIIKAEYNGKSVSNNFAVKQIIAAKKTTNVKKSKKSTVIPITVKGHNVKQTSKVKFVYKGKNKVKVNFGKTMKKQTVKVKFKGKTYKVKVNAKGKGTLKLAKKVAKKLKRGKKYTTKVTYKGPKLYKKVKLTVKFNGKKYNVKTNKLGVGKFKVTKKMVKKLKKGKVAYTITYKQASLKRFVKIK